MAVTATTLPAVAADPGDPGPTSVWGKDDAPLASPPVLVGSTKPVPNQPEAAPSAAEAAWEAAQRERAETGEAPAPPAGARLAPLVYVPEGQGDVPWHQKSSFRVSDSLVAVVNHSNGNLMLAGTDFQVAGVGQNLTLSRTYNSLDAPWGKVSKHWWQGYERYVQSFANDAVVYDSTGAALSFDKNADGSYTTPKGYSKDLKKNADGTWTLTDRKTSAKDTYDANGTLTKVTDRNKGEITVEQHDQGPEHKGFKLTEKRSGRWIDLLKTDASQWQAKDHTGRTAVFDLDPEGNLSRTTDTEGKTTTFEYDGSRRVRKIVTAEGRVTVFSYDDQNRVRSMLRGTGLNSEGHTGPTYTYSYTGATPVDAGETTVTDPEQHHTYYKHNADGEVTETRDHLQRKRGKSFDANRNIDSATDAMGSGSTPGNVTKYGWDTRNNLKSVTAPTGGQTVNNWQTVAGADRPKDSTNPDGEKTEYTYDAVGNTTSVAKTGTGGGNQTFEYNPATPTCGGFEGQRCKAITKTSASKSVTTSFKYDAKGDLTTVTPPTPLGVTKIRYDDLGRAVSVQDGRGVTVTYAYDHRDRIIKVDSSNYATVTYAYDADGNLVQRSDSTGVTKYEFDPLQRETIRTLQNGSQTKLAYTPAGNVDYYQDPAGTTDYTWNEVNKLKELKEPNGKVTSYEYDKNDVRTKTTYPGSTVQEVTVDAGGRPEKIKATSPKGTLVELDYGYSDAGKDSAKIRTRTDVLAGLKTTYQYDGAGRFSYAKEEKGGTLTESWQYCYDLAGNLTSQGVDPGCPRGTTYTLNDAQQITGKNGSTTGWSYDKVGSETAGASTPEAARTAGKYTDHRQLTSVTVGGKAYAGQYASTDMSERIKLGDTYFHNGPLGLSAASTLGVDQGFNREPGGTLNSMTTGGRSYYYLTDALGSVVALADDTGAKVNSYSYSPRGVRRGGTTEKVGQPYRFAGGYQDPTGLYHFEARYYDPNVGRFTQPDPSGQEKNPYLYADGDPVNRIDPNGLAFFDGVGKAFDLYDIGSMAKDISEGNYKDALATGVGMAAGAAA
ncbi:RHS repeat-associated core domain-containing protein, partial [Streptomyces sp. NPDC001941]|uniref:RHS repeat-associated core domain-containing protein n=1 Tax=Streptomyces sp. NPDC001941 TaxID=3154659 RepID=UPI0033310F79